MIEKVDSWFTDNMQIILGSVNLTMLSFQFLKKFMTQTFVPSETFTSFLVEELKQYSQTFVKFRTSSLHR